MVDIPGFGKIEIDHIVCDFNGTVAEDGLLVKEVVEIFKTLSKSFTIHLITADTFGSVESQAKGLPVTIKVLKSADHTAEKGEYTRSLGSERCAALGNGNNDIEMLKAAKIGIALLGGEGCSTGALLSSDIVCKSAEEALGLFLNPSRLKATLRR